MSKWPVLGHGVGLRPKHYPELMAKKTGVAWVEAVSENFMSQAGRPMAVLEKVRADVPVALHGVSLCIGSTDPLKRDYLKQLKSLVDRVAPSIVSDHLCWGSHGGRYAHDLWPLPYTEEALRNVVERINEVQDVLGRRMLLENVSSYVTFRQSDMTEWQFLSEVAQRADCGILLDINNIFVSAKNHGFAPSDYLAGIPKDRVGQFHLAGHSDCGRYLLDTHDAPVPDDVWALYEKAVNRFGPVSALVEWDDHIPEFSVLLEESRRAENIERQMLQKQAASA